MRVTPIDAVITWVDGNDPAQRERLQNYLTSLGKPAPASASPTRFADNGELEYCVASIMRFAPWFRRIHIVTDRQTPALVAKLVGTPWQQRVRVVDHREIFSGYEQHLPTFNCRPIISVLWRITDLAERFVYFNDDFMLLRRVEPSDFFRGDKTVLRGQWSTQSAWQWHRRIAQLIGLRRWVRPKVAASNRQAQQFAARLAGFDRRYLRMRHTPYPIRCSDMREFFDAHQHVVASQLSCRLRSAAQFAGESLAAHLAIAQDQAIVDNTLRVVQLKPDEQAAWRLHAKLHFAERNRAIAFACVQSLDLAPAPLRATLIAWLQRRIGTLDAALHGSADAE